MASVPPFTQEAVLCGHTAVQVTDQYRDERPRDPGGYSNQVICYQHGCWARPGALTSAGLLWLHPAGALPWSDGLHEGLLSKPNWVRYAGGDPGLLRQWISTQHAAAARWNTAAWQDMVPRLRGLHDPAADVVAVIVETWLAR